MKGIVSLLVMVLAGFLLLIFSFQKVSVPTEERGEAESLQVVIDELDSVRRETVSKYLEGDPLLNGDSYLSYDKAREARLNKMSHQELVAELKRLETLQISQATRLARMVLPPEEEAAKTAEIWGLDDIVKKGSGNGCMGARSAYSSYMSSYYDDLLRYQSGACFGDFLHPVPYFVMDPTYEEYTVTMPAAITDGEPESYKVWVSPGKMEMLKQKQKLDKMLIDDVLRMTGELP
ncbi:hypothetical protein [Endozoicomonas sp. 8E]|uniref:hypothetical protein n=1 Tax=Endozoicomonas sp. 8E TaxID=3035692 RepID=UPI002938CFF7|nr:hypothetical protein [Endozoicomonas sp. 8E]WOG29519.1 hypothetical protein P6910_07670 [Endozoicomonas sp. 8E]